MTWRELMIAAALAAALAGSGGQTGVPVGDVIKGEFAQSKIYPGTGREYWVYVPKQLDRARPAPVMVFQDGLQYNAPTVFDVVPPPANANAPIGKYRYLAEQGVATASVVTIAAGPSRLQAQLQLAQIERLKPFPDVPEALARLKTKYRIAILSNGDPDMLEAAKPHHGIPFDAVISVAAAKTFKPHVAAYTKAAEILGVAMDEVLFVANHAFDCIGAKSAGMRTAFIDRRKRPFGATPHQPDVVVDDMTSLADLVA